MYVFIYISLHQSLYPRFKQVIVIIPYRIKISWDILGYYFLYNCVVEGDSLHM